MRIFSATLLILLGLAAAGVYLAYFIVDERQQVIQLRFGEPQREIRQPGLYWKLPLVDTVEFFDKRILDLDSAPQEVIASDQKRLVVDAFARYRITEPLTFFQTVRDERIAESRLGAILESSLRRVLGSSTFQGVVRDQREALMSQITQLVNAEARGFGTEVIDVRIKRADLPQANSEAIFRRMQTERQREASEIRAQGEEQSRRIKADADRQVTVIKAEATREGEKIRGDGDAVRNQVFNDAFGRDPEFFSFYRSMQAYEQGLGSADTRLLLTPDSDFFRYFNDSRGGVTGAPN